MSAEQPIQARGGAALIERGDTILLVHQAPARLHRTRFIFNTADRFAARHPAGMMSLVVVLPSTNPPDAVTRHENAARLRRLGPALRRVVVVPVGDAEFVAVMRSMLLGLAVASQFRIQVADTLDDGITLLLAAGGPETPSREEIELDMRALYTMLGLSEATGTLTS